MNKTLLGILSAIVILNTACSPKQDTAPNSLTQSSTASNEVVVANIRRRCNAGRNTQSAQW